MIRLTTKGLTLIRLSIIMFIRSSSIPDSKTDIAARSSALVARRRSASALL